MSRFPYLERAQKLATSEMQEGRGSQLQEPTAGDELTVIPAAQFMLRMGCQRSLLLCFARVEDVYPPKDPSSLPPWENTCRRIAFDRQPSAVAIQDCTKNQGPAADSSAETAQTRRLNSSFRGATGFTASFALHAVTTVTSSPSGSRYPQRVLIGSSGE